MEHIPLIVQVSGYARAGKNTVADIISRNHGYRQFAYAHPLKAFAESLAIFDANGDPMYHEPAAGGARRRRYWDGHEDSKRNPLVELGSKAREHLGADVFTWALWQGRKRELVQALSETGGLIVTDARYQNEHVAGMNAAGFYNARYALMYIEHDGATPQGEEAEKTAVLRQQAHFVIKNNGTLEELEEIVLHYVNRALNFNVHYPMVSNA